MEKFEFLEERKTHDVGVAKEVMYCIDIKETIVIKIGQPKFLWQSKLVVFKAYIELHRL